MEERKLNLLRKNFNNMPLHTLVIDFLIKEFKNHTFFLISMFYAWRFFTLKAYNSAKKQQMTTDFRM